MKRGRAASFRPVPGTEWVKDATETLLVEQVTGKCWTLEGVEAIIWDLLTLDYSSRAAEGLLSELLQVPRAEARATLLTVLEAWKADRLVCPAEEPGCG
jgi:hypothetical protein